MGMLPEMTGMTETTGPAKPPWHLWAVGGLTLLWNGYGGYDYVMSVTENAGYLAMFTEEQREYFAAFPSWVTAIWATAVWGGVLGSALLLLRNKLAVIVYEVALAAFLISMVYQYVMTEGARINGVMGMVMSAVIGGIAVFEVVYAYFLRRKGWLH
jgi:hypothetical protein